jgi:hypothetical protein
VRHETQCIAANTAKLPEVLAFEAPGRHVASRRIVAGRTSREKDENNPKQARRLATSVASQLRKIVYLGVYPGAGTARQGSRQNHHKCLI